MKTYGQLVYMCMDLLKNKSDDAFFTEDHCIFLLNRFRILLLKQEYENKNKDVEDSNKQTLCLCLEEHEGIEGLPCEGTYMRSTEQIPNTVNISTPSVTTMDYFNGNIAYVSNKRFQFVGHNKWLQNFIYATIGPDNRLYLRSDNPQMYYLEEVKMTGVFEDAEAASELECESSDSSTCDILDKEFPLEDKLIPSLIELTVKELSTGLYKPADDENNAKDDLSDLHTFIARNAKSNLQKQIDND